MSTALTSRNPSRVSAVTVPRYARPVGATAVVPPADGTMVTGPLLSSESAAAFGEGVGCGDGVGPEPLGDGRGGGGGGGGPPLGDADGLGEPGGVGSPGSGSSDGDGVGS